MSAAEAVPGLLTLVMSRILASVRMSSHSASVQEVMTPALAATGRNGSAPAGSGSAASWPVSVPGSNGNSGVIYQ